MSVPARGERLGADEHRQGAEFRAGAGAQRSNPEHQQVRTDKGHERVAPFHAPPTKSLTATPPRARAASFCNTHSHYIHALLFCYRDASRADFGLDLMATTVGSSQS